MEIYLVLIVVILSLLYLLKPITKSEVDDFKNKNNWRGGF